MDFMGSNFYDDPYTTYADFMCEDPRNRITNYSGYCNKDVDGKLQQVNRELDPERQKAILKQALAQIQTDMPQGMGVFVPRFYAFRDTVKDFATDDDQNLIWLTGGLHYTWLNK